MNACVWWTQNTVQKSKKKKTNIRKVVDKSIITKMIYWCDNRLRFFNGFRVCFGFISKNTIFFLSHSWSLFHLVCRLVYLNFPVLFFIIFFHFCFLFWPPLNFCFILYFIENFSFLLLLLLPMILCVNMVNILGVFTDLYWLSLCYVSPGALNGHLYTVVKTVGFVVPDLAINDFVS